MASAKENAAIAETKLIIKFEAQDNQMEQNYKRYKGSQKHWNLWMLSETEDFYPTQIPNDPLKKINDYLNSKPTNIEEIHHQYQKKNRSPPSTAPHYDKA